VSEVEQQVLNGDAAQLLESQLREEHADEQFPLAERGRAFGVDRAAREEARLHAPAGRELDDAAGTRGGGRDGRDAEADGVGDEANQQVVAALQRVGEREGRVLPARVGETQQRVGLADTELEQVEEPVAETLGREGRRREQAQRETEKAPSDHPVLSDGVDYRKETAAVRPVYPSVDGWATRLRRGPFPFGT